MSYWYVPFHHAKHISPTQLEDNLAPTFKHCNEMDSSAAELKFSRIQERVALVISNGVVGVEAGTLTMATKSSKPTRATGLPIYARLICISVCSSNQPALFTFDARNTVRLWSPIVDAPLFFQLVFNYRLSALMTPHNTTSVIPDLRQDTRRRPYYIASSSASEEIFWQDRLGNVRSIQVECFEAKPPSILRIAPERVWTTSQSSTDKIASTMLSQVIACDTGTSVLIAENNTASYTTTLSLVALENAEAKYQKRVQLGTNGSKQTLWREDRYDKVVTIDTRGECSIWQSHRKSNLELVARLSLNTDSELVQALTLLHSDGPLVVVHQGVLRAIDLITSADAWSINVNPYLSGEIVSSIRRVNHNHLMLVLKNGTGLLVDISTPGISSSVRTMGVDSIMAQSVKMDDVKVNEESWILPAVPLGLDGSAIESLLVKTSDRRLLWLNLAENRWVVQAKLRVGFEDLTQLVTAGSRKVACSRCTFASE
jgi:hypothetical protein